MDVAELDLRRDAGQTGRLVLTTPFERAGINDGSPKDKESPANGTPASTPSDPGGVVRGWLWRRVMRVATAFRGVTVAPGVRFSAAVRVGDARKVAAGLHPAGFAAGWQPSSAGRKHSPAHGPSTA